MIYNPANPLIVQGDKTILLEVHNPLFEEARAILSPFAELEKSPEHIHTYRISPLSLWNAAASGLNAEAMLDGLERYSKFDIPDNVRRDILDYVARYGLVKLVKEGEGLLLTSRDAMVILELWRHKEVNKLLAGQVDAHTLELKPGLRGKIKQTLVKIGFPVEDLAGYVDGTPLAINLGSQTKSGLPFGLRAYQQGAVDAFHAGGSLQGGSGVLVLPCGAGKTVIGLGVMTKLCCETLILTTNITAVRQWINEILDKTGLDPELVGEYSGEVKQIRPVTVSTYQILTHRQSKEDEFTHFQIFDSKNWGLIIYDEVHLLPAPVFRATSGLQAKRRLGLTATLVREDQQEGEVFSLIGPKKCDVPWKVLEKQGWIATAECLEVRVPLAEEFRMEYAMAETRAKFRVASENPAKLVVVRELLKRHRDDQVLIIGQYIDQLVQIAEELKAPLITGKVNTQERERLYDGFKTGEIKVLVVSKVANFAIDLPDASVAIQVSGTFGSRQEEAQRLGRILRPKSGDNTAHFYSLVTKDSRDQEFAMNRQLFLTEQGYRYRIIDAHEL